MKLKLFLIITIFACSMAESFAHALWIETSTSGKTGQVQEVKIFLGEYASNERDSISHWFSNMKDFSLWLTTPDGKKSPLICTAAGNYFKAVFTPAAAGVYTLSVDHTVKEVYGGTKIHYYALASVTVNQSLTGSENVVNGTDLSFQTPIGKTYKLNGPVSAAVVYKKSPRADGDITVQTPAGWSKKFKTDQKGNVTFDAMWVGRYLLEGTFTEDAKGTHEGQEFSSVWHCVTYCVDVIK